ncbi:MAG: VanW family protein [Clostridiales bacterium]|nr:VanW family protein [Clostridiales bacterium]
MKKKAGQAQDYSRSSDVRSSSLVPVDNHGSDKLSGRKAAKAEVSEYEEFDYKSLGKSTNGDSGKKSPKTSKKTQSSSSNEQYGFSSKSKSKKSKASKKKIAGPIIAIAAAILLIAGAVFAAIYYLEPFKERIEVTLADGTVTEITAEEAYAELMTDRFYAGTVIDGIDVGGMTKDEAYNAVSKSLPEKPLEIKIEIKLLEKTLYPNFNDASFEYNTREILDEAFAKYRPVDDTDLVQLAECYNKVQQLKNSPDTYETAYTVQIEGVIERINKVLEPYIKDYAEVKNASIVDFDTENRTYIIDKEKIGYDIDIDTAAKEVKALFDSKTYVGVVTVPTVKKEPEITAAMINENFGLIGECSTKASSNSNRNNNLNQACENMTGTILEPGEIFSFNDIVGQRTVENGFKEATVIQGGQYEQGLGGGICQVSTTLYNAVLKADLEVVRRSAHAWPSDYVQTGLDATVDWPALDFQFKNDTDYQVVVVAWFDYSDYTCNAQVYGKKLPDGKYIELYAEITNVVSAGAEEYVEDRELETGKTKTIREAHQGITANAYKIWYNAAGEEIDRVLYNTTTYYPYGKRIAVGVLNPDGTYATMDKETGEITSRIMTTTPTPTPKPEATATPKPTESEQTRPTETDEPPPTQTDPPPPTQTDPPPPTQTDPPPEQTDPPGGGGDSPPPLTPDGG